MKIVEIYFTLFEFFVLKRSTVLVTYFGEKAQKKQADQHKVILPKKVILVKSLLLASKDTDIVRIQTKPTTDRDH